MKENTRVYYNDKCIHFTQEPTAYVRNQSFNNAWVLKQGALDNFEQRFEQFLITDIKHLVVQCIPVEGIDYLKGIFKLIQAGGGLVKNNENEYLLIHRLGLWDLPKGKLEKGESIMECAVREVEEETGLQKIELGDLMEITYHMYVIKDKLILKETFWYDMYAMKQTLHGQLEEGIEEAVWVHEDKIRQHINKSYDSIKYLMRNYI